MFHNVYNMSNLTTPTRLGRGMVVPGIDTKSPADHAATVLSYGGLHTPPQSAHESRRPSLQYSTLLEATFSASPTSLACSNPTTPARRIMNLDESSIEGWQIHTNSRSHPTEAVSCAHHFQGLALHADFTTDQPSVSDALFQTPLQQSNSNTFGLGLNSELPSAEAWRPSHQGLNGFDGQSACLGAALFPPHHRESVYTPQHEIFDHFQSSMPQISPIYAPSTTTALHEYPVYQQPEVVVPSQLSPDDGCISSNLHDYTHSHGRSSVLTSSLGSVTPDILDYEMMGHPSPMGDYFAHSDDNEDYLEVKPARTRTPPTVTHWSATIPSHPKKRHAKRSRNSTKSNTWHSHDFCGVDVRLQGDNWVCANGKYLPQQASSSKMHECTFVNANGVPCPRRFARSEHLKRHAGSHSDVRLYPCPLPDCGKAIGRPDNAGDHFKTHLRPTKPGKRNHHFEWEVLRAAIDQTYTDRKRAKKLIDGLQRWIDDGMPETAQHRRKMGSTGWSEAA